MPPPRDNPLSFFPACFVCNGTCDYILKLDGRVKVSPTDTLERLCRIAFDQVDDDLGVFQAHSYTIGYDGKENGGDFGCFLGALLNYGL